MMVKSIIITAADAHYAPLANDLVTSIRTQNYSRPLDIGILDVGMDDGQRQYFAAQGIKIVQAVADIDYPMREHWEKEKPGVRTLTARPFLRRYFPGYDAYMWMDADVWVQTPEAIETMMPIAETSDSLAIACELDRCYKPFFESATMWGVFNGWYAANYNAEIVAQMALKPMLNAGVFAMGKNAPHWDAWAEIYTGVLQKTGEFNSERFMADQLGLNILLYLRGLPHAVMPASYNWLTAYALPKIDRATGMYVEPQAPHRVISQFHLTRPNKVQVEKLEYTDGGVVERKMIYSAWADSRR